LAGAPGFEPGNGGIKICRTTLIFLTLFSQLEVKSAMLLQRVTDNFPTANHQVGP
jgi:hypothetical protein